MPARGGERGQTATEYMLVISVIVIALIAGAYVFVPQFKSGVQTLSEDVKQMLATGSYGNVQGVARDGMSTGGGAQPQPPPNTGGGGVMGGAAG